MEQILKSLFGVWLDAISWESPEAGLHDIIISHHRLQQRTDGVWLWHSTTHLLQYVVPLTVPFPVPRPVPLPMPLPVPLPVHPMLLQMLLPILLTILLPISAPIFQKTISFHFGARD